MVWVTEAHYIENYKIRVKFNDDTEGIINFKPIIKEDSRKIISELEKKEVFKDFSVELDTISWKNGVDFAPEYLYQLLKESKHVA